MNTAHSRSHERLPTGAEFASELIFCGGCRTAVVRRNAERMALITEADSRHLLERATEARHQAIGLLAAHEGSAAEREALAGALFRQYSYELLEDLLRVAARDDNSDPAWIRRRHDEQLLELGRVLRDVFPEGEARHAVAQVIQRELLEAERRLKLALRLPGASGVGMREPAG